MPLVQVSELSYSDKYYDEEFEYRHVILPKDKAKQLPRTHLMTETEWRNLGIAQSPGWVHYMIHHPEPHILMFRRPLPKSEVKAAAIHTTNAIEVSGKEAITIE